MPLRFIPAWALLGLVVAKSFAFTMERSVVGSWKNDEGSNRYLEFKKDGTEFDGAPTDRLSSPFYLAAESHKNHYPAVGRIQAPKMERRLRKTPPPRTSTQPREVFDGANLDAHVVNVTPLNK